MLLFNQSWLSATLYEYIDARKSKWKWELVGSSFTTPVILKTWLSLVVITFPNASSLPKYFFAAASVIIREFGSVKAVLKSPEINWTVKTLKKVESAIKNFLR